jgi:aldehyde dehydrogenase (NAD+)
MNPLTRAGNQFIDGAWVPSTSGARVGVIDPTTAREIAQVCTGSAEDIDAAVLAARRAFTSWSTTTLVERLTILRRAADILSAQVDELAQTISIEVGTPASVSRDAQVLRPIAVLTSLCDAAGIMQWTERIDATLVVREPAGVVGAITPWNFPLHQAIAKVGAALAAGCTVVLKPSELAPLSAYCLADALDQAGLPAGALNVVTGQGESVGKALVDHPDVDLITFTGSTTVGRQIGATAARTVKRVALELGGKGPSVVLPGADIAAAAAATAARCFTNSGQVCAALSRLLVGRDQLAEAERALEKFVAAQRLGNPLDPDTTLGPVISEAQRSRIYSLIDQGLVEGARLVAGGPLASVPDTGFFVAPTVLSDVTSEMRIAQTEIFGPVLCVMPYDDVEDAVRIANDTPYGLVAAVWGPDSAEAVHVASRIRAGMVGVNGGRINVKAPFGGYKQSGVGREFGTFGVAEFLEVKSVNFPTPDAIEWPPA